MQRDRKISLWRRRIKKNWLRLLIYFLTYHKKYISILPIFKITQNILLYNNILNTLNTHWRFLAPVLINHVMNNQSLILLYLLFWWCIRLLLRPKAQMHKGWDWLERKRKPRKIFLLKKKEINECRTRKNLNSHLNQNQKRYRKIKVSN